MLRKKIYLFVLTVAAALLGACTADDMRGAGQEANGEGEEMPVVFDISLPATRAIVNPKKRFTNGDVIHITGTFQVKLDGQVAPQTRIRYGAMMFDGKKWTPLDGSDLKWPNTAESGTFEAYFISGSTGVLYHKTDETTGQDYSKTRTYMLSDITPDGSNSDQNASWSDPLRAEKEDVEYGYAVSLEFHHLCAYLTLEELEPAVSDYYWFSTPGSALPNAFYLSLNEDNTLQFNTESLPEIGYTADNQKGGPSMYCISGKAATIERTTTVGGGDDGEGETKTETITVANYFLFPGDYSKFVLSYPVTLPTMGSNGKVEKIGVTQSYMSYDFDDIPDEVGGMGIEKIRPELVAGRTYVLNVIKSPGTTITIPPDGEGWDESENYTEVDPKEFLEHVTSGTRYEKDDTLILEEVNGGTRLRCNVDFHNQFDYWDQFQPNLPAGLTFDGDYHYIRNAGGQLFHFNDGTIKNLGIKTISVDFTTYETEGENKDNDMSRLGALCMYNHPTGIIENIRMKDVTMKAHIKTDRDQEMHNVGCIIGSNVGRLSQVELSGQWHLTVDNSLEDDMDATVNIGGIAGQNSGLGRIEDVSWSDNSLKITIENRCTGTHGAFYIGGIAGYNTAFIDNVNLRDVTVDSSESRSVVSYLGGMVGESAISTNGDEDPNAKLSSCIVSGVVRAGVATPFNDLHSSTYIGGIAGALNGVPVEGCRSAVSVYGAASPVEGVTYATGGAFGRIRTATSINNMIAYGSVLRGPEHIGNFAGIVPEGESWDETYKDNNIIVRSFSSIDNIGATISQ